MPTPLFEKGNTFGGQKKKGCVSLAHKLRLALAKVERKEGISLIEHAVRRSFIEDKVLIAIMNKILPDLSKQEITGAGGKNFEIIVKTINQHQLELERKQAEGKVIDAEVVENKE